MPDTQVSLPPDASELERALERLALLQDEKRIALVGVDAKALTRIAEEERALAGTLATLRRRLPESPDERYRLRSLAVKARNRALVNWQAARALHQTVSRAVSMIANGGVETAPPPASAAGVTAGSGSPNGLVLDRTA
jgi:hypothetical protein